MVEGVLVAFCDIGSQSGEGQQVFVLERQDVYVEFAVNGPHHLFGSLPPAGVETAIVIPHNHLHYRCGAQVELGVGLIEQHLDIVAKRVKFCCPVDEDICIEQIACHSMKFGS